MRFVARRDAGPGVVGVGEERRRVVAVAVAVIVVGHDRMVGALVRSREIEAARIGERLRTRRGVLRVGVPGAHVVPGLVRHHVALRRSPHGEDVVRMLGEVPHAGCGRLRQRPAKPRRAVGAARVDHRRNDVRPDRVAHRGDGCPGSRLLRDLIEGVVEVSVAVGIHGHHADQAEAEGGVEPVVRQRAVHARNALLREVRHAAAVRLRPRRRRAVIRDEHVDDRGGLVRRCGGPFRRNAIPDRVKFRDAHAAIHDGQRMRVDFPDGHAVV